MVLNSEKLKSINVGFYFEIIFNYFWEWYAMKNSLLKKTWFLSETIFKNQQLMQKQQTIQLNQL